MRRRPHLPFVFTLSCSLRTLNISRFTLQQVGQALVPTIRSPTLLPAETEEHTADSSQHTVLGSRYPRKSFVSQAVPLLLYAYLT